VDLTESYAPHIPVDVLPRYVWAEVRNAAAVLRASDPLAFEELALVLRTFRLTDIDIMKPGGNRGTVAIRLDSLFEASGWRAVRVNTQFRLVGMMKSTWRARTYDVDMFDTSVANDGFEVDNMKRRVALDVEWNAKDGNLDRDLSAYRALYDVGLIDVAVIITRDDRGIRDLATLDLHSQDAKRRLGTATSTNMRKLVPRLTRGDAGGCPVLAVGITRATWQGAES
jgi:hypothetical protein